MHIKAALIGSAIAALTLTTFSTGADARSRHWRTACGPSATVMKHTRFGFASEQPSSVRRSRTFVRGEERFGSSARFGVNVRQRERANVGVNINSRSQTNVTNARTQSNTMNARTQTNTTNRSGFAEQRNAAPGQSGRSSFQGGNAGSNMKAGSGSSSSAKPASGGSMNPGSGSGGSSQSAPSNAR
jgi:hypothetical protein